MGWMWVAHAADYYWNNGAATGLWNTTDANWYGITWANSPSSQAVFTMVGGSVALSQPITAGPVTFGTTAYNAASLQLSGGSLTAASLTVQGKSDNSGSYATNPSLTLAVPTVNIAGAIAVGRANLVVSGGSVTADRIVTTDTSADWGRFVISGGTVTATHGVDGSLHGSTFAVDLNGGTLRTPSLRVADREFGPSNDAKLTFRGGTLAATADHPNFITLYGGNQNAYIGHGGAVIDTAGHEVGISIHLLPSGDGGLTKQGQGRLTLSGDNQFYGPTKVRAGTLRLTQPSLQPASRVEIEPGAVMELDFSGSDSVRALVVDGISLPPGVYSAMTHPGRLMGTGSLVVSSGFSNASWSGASDGVSSFRRMKYGFFVHYVFGGVLNTDGSSPVDANDMADRFDAEGFAEDLHSMGVEYCIFTAWHFNVVCLWPSAAMERWMPGHTVRRDLLGDMIDAVKAKGIRVLLYTHPRDGHDMSRADQITTGWGPGSGSYDPDWNQFNRTKWNDFTNDIYADLIDRYGSRLDGLFLDESSPSGDSWRVVDYPRLRQTIKSRQPDLLMMQNYYGNLYSCDIGATEVNYWYSWVPGTDPNHWPATGRPMSMVMGSGWSAGRAPGTFTPRYSSTEMYRMTVLKAGVHSTDGGGINWASGPYAGGGWETGVLEQMQEIGSWIAAIRPSICNTYPSQSWITPPNATIHSLPNGLVATRSAADGREFIHVLTPPAGQTLTVPAPADGRGYRSASLLENGHPVSLVRNGDGSMQLTLPAGHTWNPRNTCIALEPVTVTWVGNTNDAGAGTAAWASWMDNFTQGIPVASRFRSGDNIGFLGQGASQVVPWAFPFAVGDLGFAGKNYQIQPYGSPTLTLASGRIHVADGITATFQETAFGGPLTLAGEAGISKTGGGALMLDLPSQIRGNTNLMEGVVSVRKGALGQQGSIVFDGGTLRMLAGNREDLSSRIRHGRAPIRIDTGGNDLVWSTPLHSSNGGGLTKLGGGTLTLAGSSMTADGPITVESGSVQLDAPSTGSVMVPNPGFETPAYAAQGWGYGPSGAQWTFQSPAGIASNNTPWVVTSPQGNQVAYLQNNGAISTQVTVSASGHYRLSFQAANRSNYLASGLVVTLDGNVVGTYSSHQIGQTGEFRRIEIPAFPWTAGSHTLTFQGQQNGSDSTTLIDDVTVTAVASGGLADGSALALTGAGSTFDPGPNTIALESLASVSGSVVNLAQSHLVITGNNHSAVFAGSLSGVGSVTIQGTLRMVGNATLSVTGPLINDGVLDLMTWNGTLPAGFVNHGIVLDRRHVKVDTCTKSGANFVLGVTGYKGHSYQLQRSDLLTGPWQDIGATQPGNNAPLTFTDPGGATGPRRFYRISVSP